MKGGVKMGLFKRFTKPSKKEAEEHDFNHLIDILLHDESVEKRYDAAVRLGSLHDARAVPALIQAFGDGGSIHIKGVAVVYVSVAAVEALGEIGGPEATQVLSKVLRVSSSGMSFAAKEALKKLGATDILRKYAPFSNQSWEAIALDESGNTYRGYGVQGRQESLQKLTGPGDYVLLEYSIADIYEEKGERKALPDGAPRPYKWVGKVLVEAETPYPKSSLTNGLVSLEARRLHLDHAFNEEISVIDLAGDPVELLSVQKKAFVDFFKSRYLWFRTTKELDDFLSRDLAS